MTECKSYRMYIILHWVPDRSSELMEDKFQRLKQSENNNEVQTEICWGKEGRRPHKQLGVCRDLPRDDLEGTLEQLSKESKEDGNLTDFKMELGKFTERIT